MRDRSAEIHRGRRSRFGLAVFIVFVLHVGLVFWFGERPPAKSSAAEEAGFRVTPVEVSSLLLEDPTLFVLPHPRAVSGEVWIREPTHEFRPPVRLDPPARWLPMPREELGTAFVDFVRREWGGGFDPIVMNRPALIVPPRSELVLKPVPSSLRIGGDLASRKVAHVPPLPLLQQTEPPTNSVIDVWVDERGYVFTAVPRGAGTALSAGDTNALRLAQLVRFEPIEPQPAEGDRRRSLTWGG